MWPQHIISAHLAISHSEHVFKDVFSRYKVSSFKSREDLFIASFPGSPCTQTKNFRTASGGAGWGLGTRPTFNFCNNDLQTIKVLDC